MCLFILGTNRSFAQGVMFSQYKIILDQNAITSMYVTNPTENTFTYQISFVDKRMDENGKVSDVSIGEEFTYSLKKYLRAFPRNIILQPGQSQEVQIQLKTPQTLPDGEYRSFIMFTPREPNSDIDTTSQDGVKMAIQFRIGSAIPIVYRKNASLGEVTILDESLKKEGSINWLIFNLNRAGNRSVYGKVFVTGWRGGNETAVYTPKGNSAIYCEIPKLKLSLPIATSGLDRDENGAVHLKISFIDSERQRVKSPTVWAEKTIILNLPQ